jgi:ribonuclease-3 family protein
LADYLSIRLTEDEIRAVSSLGLAHIGDAVYELMVRSWLVMSGRATAKGLHKAAVGHVSAPAQARAAGRLMTHLTEEEQAVFRRGRNTRVHSVPRNASLDEYHASTALETLFGYLYLKGQTERLNELFDRVMNSAEP